MANSHAYAFPTNLLLLTWLITTATLFHGSVARFSCGVDKFKAEVVGCYQDRGVKDDAIFNNFRNHEENDVTTLLASLMISHGNDFCNNNASNNSAPTRSNYREAVQCVYQRNKDCNTLTTKSIVADPEDAALIVDALCDDRKDINFQCITERKKHFHNCASEKSKDLEEIGREHYLLNGRCFATNTSAYCAKREYKACGCATSRAYSDVVYDLLQPSNCLNSNMTSHRVKCRMDDAQRFVSDGLNAANSLTTNVFLLPLSVSLLGTAMACQSWL